MSDRHVRRYAAYKESGVEWLGEVPEHWEVKRLKELGKIQNSNVDKKTHPDEKAVRLCNYVDVYKHEFINSRLLQEFMLATADESEIKKFAVKQNDVLITKDSETADDIAIPALVTETLIGVLYGYHLAQIRTNSKKLFGPYLFRLFQSNSYNSRFEVSAKGITRVGLGQSAISDALTPVPPLPEQTSIAAYLDTKAAQIDRQVELLCKKATQYGKLKQSLINETVTRGLDSTVPMKESGVEWIGEVPAHWEVKRLKELGKIQNSNVDKKTHPDEKAVRLCNYVDVYKHEFINSRLLQEFMLATADESEIKKFAVKQNDVLITKDSETADDIAIPALVTETLIGVLYGYHLAQIRTNSKKLFGPYLFRLFQSNSYNSRFEVSAKGITRVGLGQSAISDALTPVPPLPEQTSIAAYLDTKTAQIDRIVSTINTQIDKLKELRKTLINDVVTGKIKVIPEGEFA